MTRDRNPAQEGIDASRRDAQRAREEDSLTERLGRLDRPRRIRQNPRVSKALAKARREAPVAYTARYGEITQKAERLMDLLREHKDRQTADPGNWGLVGDLGHVDVELGRLVRFLANEEE